MATKQIHLRVSDALHEDVENYASKLGLSVAAAARVLLRQALEANEMKYQYRSGEQS